MLLVTMAALLLQPEAAMGAVRDSCYLFVTAVMPGLLPYLVLSAMLLSRVRGRSPWLLTLLGWCGGSPSGARLLAMTSGLTGRQRAFVSTATATMSPMFLVGTCGAWLGSARAGFVLLASVLAGGGIAGLLAGAWAGRAGEAASTADALPQTPLALGAAVEQAARTLLMVCGTMAMWRMLAELAVRLCPPASLLLTTLLEVTRGVQQLAALPLPLALRTALVAGATALGGMAILTQNRAVRGSDAPPLAVQAFWQAVHGAASFLLALGLMLLWDAGT